MATVARSVAGRGNKVTFKNPWAPLLATAAARGELILIVVYCKLIKKTNFFQFFYQQGLIGLRNL